MGPKLWLLLNAFAVIYAAPRELTTDELITEPRPGEEYVNIQTSSQDKIDLVDKSFTTSHRIPELSKTNRSQDFQTAHKIPSGLERNVRSSKPESAVEQYETAESNPRVVYTVVEGTTNEPPLERVVTRTSIKMSKSKKVQKSVLKVAHDGLVDIKADEGVIDERPNVDAEEQEIMKKKFLKSERTEPSVEFQPPIRFNVPFEDEVEDVSAHSAHLIIPNPVIATTQAPPITTFNYKNVYDKRTNGFLIPSSAGAKGQDKYKYETVASESIKTAESKTITSKKDTKQDKKDKYKKEDKEESGFYLVPVNKQQKFKEDNYDFVDVEEKVLVPAGSSPSQSSRINIKKGPNGQEYEYEYVYYYYDDDDEGPNGGAGPKEGKVVASTTEKVYNGHDGPAREDQEQNSVQSTSTSGSKYLPTEAPKTVSRGKTKIQHEVVEEVEEQELPAQNFVSKGSRGGGSSSSSSSSSNGGSRFSSSNRQSETVNNEVYPSSGRSQSRSRGRTANAAVQTEDIPSIGEERLPANTRFPPRSRANNAPATSPQPQETTARSRGREGNSNQNRLRINNLGLLDSSSFRTHSSDASVEDDASHDAELQRKALARGQTTESHRRGTRPTSTVAVEEEVPVVTRRPAIRKPVEERRPRPQVEEEEEEIVEDRRSKVPVEESERTSRIPVPVEEPEKRVRVPFEDEVERRPKVPLEEEEEVRRPQVPLEVEEPEGEPRQKEVVGEASLPEERRPQTTRESDAEEGVFENSKIQSSEDQEGQIKNIETRPVVESTTEDQSAVGLTNAMMEKVALDLYAILQQAQNENIRTNFIDGNSTDVTTDFVEGQTGEYSTSGDDSTPEPVSVVTTTTTTTTTTTPAPTTTTTTTTTPAPSPAPGRGRFGARGRVAGNGKGRSKVSTTTTEAPEEVTSPKPRGRFQPNHGTRGSGSGVSFGRKPTKSFGREPTTEEAPASEEAPRAAPERTFGDRPRSRFRASGKVTTSAPTTAATPAPSQPSGAGVAGSRGSSADRFHSRRRGGSRTALPATQHAAGEGQVEEERHETNQETSGLSEEATPTVSSLRPTRPRIGGSVRPLRPGPRAPLLLPQRGHAAAVNSSPAPVEQEEVKEEVVETEAHVQQPIEEGHEAPTTPVGDALTRLKSRPRLRIGANTNHQRPQTPPPPPTNRRKLVSSLLPKRKPTEEKQAEKVEETEERGIPEEIPVEEDVSAIQAEPPSTTAEPETKGLSGLLAGRRRNLNRRPGTIYSRAQPAEA